MAYNGGGHAGYGIFTWSLFFTWGTMPERVRSKLITGYEPYPSPTMAGGLFTIDRNYFYEIGSYDEGMDIWGAENLEMSFRVNFFFF